MEIKLVRNFKDLVLPKQSLFALPWLLSSIFLPYATSSEVMPFSEQLNSIFFVTIGFFSARFAGMCLNRVIDRHIDAKNLRTKERMVACGKVSHHSVLIFSFLLMGLILISSIRINSSCLAITPLIIFLLFFYSFTKRFTFLSHFVLGLIQALVPVVGWMGITGGFSPLSLLLGVSLGCIIAAGDILYAFQDKEFDRKEGLYSIPACFSEKVAMGIAKMLYAISLISLFTLGWIEGLSFVYFCFVVFLSIVFIRAFYNLKSGISVNQVFTEVNTLSGFLVFASIIGELTWRAL